MVVAEDKHYIQFRRAAGKPERFLIVLKPDLETCFFASMRRLKLKSKVAEGRSELHRVLGSPTTRRHGAFQRELLELNTVARQRGIPVFTTEIEEILLGMKDG